MDPFLEFPGVRADCVRHLGPSCERPKGASKSDLFGSADPRFPCELADPSAGS